MRQTFLPRMGIFWRAVRVGSLVEPDMRCSPAAAFLTAAGWALSYMSLNWADRYGLWENKISQPSIDCQWIDAAQVD